MRLTTNQGKYIHEQLENLRKRMKKNGSSMNPAFEEMAYKETYEQSELRYEKLWLLENIEEELGIDLITLYNALKQQKVYCIIEDTIMENSFSVKLVFEHDDYYLRIDGCHFVRVADYGFTWALTREELECQQ